MAKGIERSAGAGSAGRRWAVASLAGWVAAAGLAAWPADAAAQEPVAAARFSITVDGVEIASFSDAELSSDIVVEGGGTTSRLRTQATATFKRPQGSSLALWTWHEAVLLRPGAPRQNLVVIAYGPQGQAVGRYHLTEAWPTKCVVSELKLGASEVIMESVTVVAERLQRVE
jgi:phage tail-like protein